MTYGQIILSFLRNMKTADQCDQMIEKNHLFSVKVAKFLEK